MPNWQPDIVLIETSILFIVN